ncbi:MAG: uncharacterized protein JWP46_2459 [Modestobacter sp.]|jgi:hypothetical protein|nr:uncharacterized protein [Modestobacter sp.]
MTGDIRQPVVSGLPYPVTSSAAGGRPVALEDFLGDTQFTIDLGNDPLLVRGCGSRLEGMVRFHEKDRIGGKDVRVWHVTAREDGFVAEHIAAF